MTGANRRKNRRVRAQGLATYVQSAGAGFTQLPCFVEDISSGGMLLRTDRTLDVGTGLNLTLVRSGMKTAVQLSGTVVGYRQGDGAKTAPGLRIAFHQPTPEVAARLEQLINEFLGKEGLSASMNPVVAKAPAAGSELDRLRHALEEAQKAVQEGAGRIANLQRQLDAARKVIDERDLHIRTLMLRR